MSKKYVFLCVFTHKTHIRNAKNTFLASFLKLKQQPHRATLLMFFSCFLSVLLNLVTAVFLQASATGCVGFSLYEKKMQKSPIQNEQGKITKPLLSISCVKQTVFEQNTQWGQKMLPFLSAFFSNLLCSTKALLGSLTIFLSSYLKRKKTVDFCNILVL